MYASIGRDYLDDIDLEIEYSPSRASNRAEAIDPEQLVEQFVRIHIEETKRVARIYQKRSVCYGSGLRESVDIYFKSKETGNPIFVYIHGGYWVALDKSVSGICVGPLVERGYRVMIVDYNLCPNATLQQIVQQIRKFSEFLLDYASTTDAKSISLCGHSAGAHLIATLMEATYLNPMQFHLVKDIFLISGIYDLRELWKTEAGNPGNVLSLTAELATALSPILYKCIKHLQGGMVHILAAEYDSNTFKMQSIKFYELVRKLGISSNHYVFARHDHFTIIEDLRDEESSIMKYLLHVLE